MQRIYDQAKTPFQRVRDALGETCDKLNKIYEVLDPVRLLKQIGTLQDALWRHAVLRNGQPHSPNCDESLVSKMKLEFETDSSSTNDGKAGGGVNVEGRGARKYHRTREPRKPRKPRDWRTRKDPFESVWIELVGWLEVNPERTAKSVFNELQQKYPGQFPSGQLRTLQRRVQAWRAETILSFEDHHLRVEKFGDNLTPPKLAVVDASR